MAARKKTLLHFKEIASRLNCVQIPIFGVQWTPAEPERKVVRDVLTFLEDRRVLYNPCAWEMEREVTDSVLRIRETLTQAIQRLGEASNAAPAMRAMRAACREYLDRSREALRPSRPLHRPGTPARALRLADRLPRDPVRHRRGGRARLDHPARARGPDRRWRRRRGAAAAAKIGPLRHVACEEREAASHAPSLRHRGFERR